MKIFENVCEKLQVIFLLYKCDKRFYFYDKIGYKTGNVNFMKEFYSC